ncbi:MULTISPECIES: hypothetical protein [Streptomyces]|uniref:Integral membrane protein n=1 Tax=Streptomyces chartreusis NRRL 3882 TaxID=1079985 RepID=A0A2N9B7E9_STRCX|nr:MULTISPECIES: hypothetical protein [Streptomyces]SOR79250.1 hypothetical protein SCNRRL3882_2712 [Streptomyces chartreusis NRRL 3882]
MSDLDELDRPEPPTGPAAPGALWDARPEQEPTPATTPAPAPEAAADRKPAAPRRGAADPVKALMHRHRELCERAVDPLEIAAGLEAHGITDRTAARFRHRDVFSLAEEMYARVSRDGSAPPPAAPTAPRARADWALLTLLPGTLCAAAVAAVHLTHGQSRLFAAAAGALAVTLALGAALRRGPLSRPDRTAPGRATTGTTWLVAYALLGNGLLDGAVTGGPDSLPTGTADGPWPLTATPVLALTLACAPAAWTAHLFAARARRKLAASRGLEDFAAAVRPLLLGTFVLFLGALVALLTLCAAVVDEPAAHAETLTLGALLFLARLLTTHGFAYAPAVVLTATATLQAAALAAVFASRLPGCGFLATPVETLVTTWGAGSVPTLACGTAALALLVHATRKLTRASAHAPPGSR